MSSFLITKGGIHQEKLAKKKQKTIDNKVDEDQWAGFVALAWHRSVNPSA
jgi:hypothetical protein